MAKTEKRYRRKEHGDTDLAALMQRVGKNVTRLRKGTKGKAGRNLSQQALSSKADIALSSLVDIEQGKANIRLSTVMSVAKALGVPPHELLK